MSSDLSVVPVEDFEVPEFNDWREVEPHFTSLHLQRLYRELVVELDAEFAGLGATAAMMTRTVARDYVVRVTADQGETRARQLERDRRMMAMLKQLSDNSHRAGDDERMQQLVLGLVPVIMGVIESRVGHDQLLAGKLKEDIGAELSAYVRRALP